MLDNGIVRVVIDERGQIASLIDHASGREAIAPGAVGNRLQLHRDIPNHWDAWDVDEHYRRNVTELDRRRRGRARYRGRPAVVRIRRTFGASTIEQQIILAARRAVGRDPQRRSTGTSSRSCSSSASRFDVHADRSASETQFGHVFRPTHTNTSWEYARFEICAHRWIHVAEPGYGVAVSNDSTYGHDVARHSRVGGGTTTTVRLSLVRAPRYPDPRC